MLRVRVHSPPFEIGVGGQVCRTALGVAGTDVDDRAAATGDHLRHRFAAEDERPLEIRRHDLSPDVDRRFEQRGAWVDRRVVDEDIQAPELADGLGDQRDAVLFAAHIGADERGLASGLQ